MRVSETLLKAARRIDRRHARVGFFTHFPARDKLAYRAARDFVYKWATADDWFVDGEPQERVLLLCLLAAIAESPPQNGEES